jgi:hypothetical protein
MDKNKNEKFQRLAQARVEKLLKSIGTLSNLSNTYTYEYSNGEIDHIFAALQEELVAARSKFDSGLAKLEARQASVPDSSPFGRKARGFSLAS